MYEEKLDRDTHTEKKNNDNTEEFDKVFGLVVEVAVSLGLWFIERCHRRTISFKHGI